MEANYFRILYWFCHTSTWIHHRCTRVPHPEPPYHLPSHTIPPGCPSAPVPRILYQNWTGDSFLKWYYICLHAIPPNHPTLSLSHRVQKTVLYICVSLLSHIQGYRSVQISSVAQSCPTLCDPMNHSTPGISVHHQLPELTQTHIHRSVVPSSHLILCRPLLLLPPVPPSIRVFSSELTLHIRWTK